MVTWSEDWNRPGMSDAAQGIRLLLSRSIKFTPRNKFQEWDVGGVISCGTSAAQETSCSLTISVTLRFRCGFSSLHGERHKEAASNLLSSRGR